MINIRDILESYSKIKKKTYCLKYCTPSSEQT